MTTDSARGANLRSLAVRGETTLLPCAHDAITARIIEDSGFKAFAVGASTVSAVRLALPDLGLQSFGEYRDSVASILGATRLPALVDIESGFGGAKAITRTVRTFEAMGASAVAIEDLVKPSAIGGAPQVIETDLVARKINAALHARTRSDLMVVGRTDAASIAGPDEAIRRARLFEQLGADAVLVTGLPDLDAMRRLRDQLTVPIIAVIVEGGPWVTPTPAALAAMGYEYALYPASLILGVLTACKATLQRIGDGHVSLPEDSLDYGDVAQLLRLEEWAAVDQAVDAITSRTVGTASNG